MLLDAAQAAGVEVELGVDVTGVTRDGTGRVTGVRARARGGAEQVVRAALTVGADGLRFGVARAVDARPTWRGTTASALIYGYRAADHVTGFHWFYRLGGAAGVIPTNDGQVTLGIERYVQPLIRYAISDLATLADGPNPTGMPFRRLADVAGRNDDILFLPGVRGGTVAVPPARLRAPLATIPALRQYQIRCDARGMHVWIALREHAAEDIPARVRTCLHDALTTAGANPPPITVTVVAEIPREPGSAAKLKTVLVEHATLT